MPNSFELENRERKRDIRKRRGEDEATFRGDNPQDPEALDDGSTPPKYDLEEIDRRRNWVGEQIWKAVASGSLDIKNTTALSNFLSSLRPEWFGGEHGLVDQKEKGRHMRRLFLGDLDEEGWGIGDSGYARALDEYRPNWSRMVSGMTKGADGLYSTDGGKFYDAFGRLVRTGPATPTASDPGFKTAPPLAAPTLNGTGNTPTPNPTFYGGSAPVGPYGISQPQVAAQQRQQRMNRNRPRQQQQSMSSAPAWYSTWRF